MFIATRVTGTAKLRRSGMCSLYSETNGDLRGAEAQWMPLLQSLTGRQGRSAL